MAVRFLEAGGQPRGVSSGSTGRARHVDPGAPAGDDDWRIAWGMFDIALSEELGLDLAELAALRSSLAWRSSPTLACGESWPRDLVGKNSKKSATNRRTEVLFFAPDVAPDLTAEEIYGEHAIVWRDHIEPEPRADFTVALVSTEDVYVADTPFKVTSPQGRVRYGHFGENGEATLLDIQAGPVQIHVLDHDDVEAKIWAVRTHAAIEGGDAEAAYRCLLPPKGAVAAIAAEYRRQFGGDLADGLRGLVADSELAHVVERLLARAGFPSDHDYVWDDAPTSEGQSQ